MDMLTQEHWGQERVAHVNLIDFHICEVLILTKTDLASADKVELYCDKLSARLAELGCLDVCYQIPFGSEASC